MRGGGGGGGGGASDRPDIGELEMARNRNFYEQESLTREQQQASDEILNRIKELALRQQHINEELAKLISELQLAKTDQERERLQKELQRLKEEMRNNLENIDQARQQLSSNALNNDRSRAAQDSLERARHQMNRSLELMDRDDLQQARSAGSRASDALEDVEEQLQQFGRAAAAQRMQELQERMSALRDQQREIVEQAQKAQELHRSPSMEGQKELESTQKDLGTRKEAVASDFVEMMEEASELAERSAQTQELMSRRLGDWMRETSREGVYEDIRESKPLVEYGIWDAAVPEERKIGDKLQTAERSLQSVADSLVNTDLEGLQKALEHIDRLLQREEVARALAEQPRDAGAAASDRESPDEAESQAGTRPDEESPGQGGGTEPDEESDFPGSGQSDGEREAPATPGQPSARDDQQTEPSGDRQGGGQPGSSGDPSQDRQATQSPQDGSQPSAGASQNGGRRAGLPRSVDNIGGGGGSTRDWLGADDAMRNFIEVGYDDWLRELNDAESLLPQDSPIRTEVTRVRERIEMMRREWRARKLAPRFDLFLEFAAVPLAETADALQREIMRQLNAQEFLAVDEGEVPERYRERVAEYFKRLSEAEGRP
jgi:hypothetical protein